MFASCNSLLLDKWLHSNDIGMLADADLGLDLPTPIVMKHFSHGGFNLQEVREFTKLNVDGNDFHMTPGFTL